MKETKISWAHATVNFWIGCHSVSDECSGCYAAALVKRMGGSFNVLRLTATTTWKTAFQIDASAAAQRRTKIIFTCSLSDYFHMQADRWRPDAWRVIRDCPHVRWLILTKRPERILDHLPADWGDGYSNVWLGVTVGTPSSYHRLTALNQVPCRLRFISVQPLLESVHDIPLDGIGWVAVGGMSGALHRKRRMQLGWAYEVWRRCQDAGIPFLFKQSSDIYTERGIDALGRYIASVENKPYDSAQALIRQYPGTVPLLLPFTEHGRRYRDEQWEKLVQISGVAL
jgi:protein gp37